mmetsp:Transcript_104412/g.239118  ORF Transcript_104412/g.239118 Transcript_104412/m.239118 type:complete len:604 (-) Transcript_104412:167-1978(-)
MADVEIQRNESDPLVDGYDLMEGIEADWLEEEEMSALQVIRQQPRSAVVALFAALGGFLFGLDIGYIGPVYEMQSFIDDISHGEPLGAATKGFITGVFSIGCIVTSLPMVSSLFMDKLGRKWTIMSGAWVYACGAAVQCLASDVNQLYVGRLMSGFGIGMLSTTVPVYQTEVAPKETRGALGTLYQMGITSGILSASLVDMWFTDAASGWRWAGSPRVGVALFLAIGMLCLPESPRHLARKGNNERTMQTLQWLRRGAREDYIEVEFDCVIEEVEAEMRMGEPEWGEFFSGFMLRVLMVGMAAQFLQQLCGMNAFMYYGPALFGMAGIDGTTFQVIQCSVNFLMTFPAVAFVDRAGRTFLLKWTGIVMATFILILGTVGMVFIEIPEDCPLPKDTDCAHTAGLPYGQVDPVVSAVIVGSGLMFVAGFALGWGPVVWVFCAEIFPMKYRSKGVGMTTTANWVGNYIVAQVTTLLMQNTKFGTFIFYGFFCILCVVFAMWVPETANIPMEEVQILFEQKFGMPPRRTRSASTFRDRLLSSRPSSARASMRGFGSAPDFAALQEACGQDTNNRTPKKPGMKVVQSTPDFAQNAKGTAQSKLRFKET